MTHEDATTNAKFLEHSPYLTCAIERINLRPLNYGITCVDSFNQATFKLISREDVMEMARLHNEQRRQHRISPSWDLTRYA